MNARTDRLRADHVIVGAGSAGCVLARRLSADPAVRVVLLEAGGTDRNPLIHIPGGAATLMVLGRANWNHELEPQVHACSRRPFFPLGKTLGGSSSINGMVYSRGAAGDYDAWAKLGNPGWSFGELLPYFRRVEAHFLGESELHGGRGPVRVTRPGSTNPLTAAWFEAGREAGHPYQDDLGFTREGFGPTDVTAAGGRRCSAADAYLRPVRHRRNLKVITSAPVTRILLRDGRAEGVACRTRGRTLRIHAARGVILSTGAVHSPQLLMLSGIGAADALRRHGIDPMADLPGVGLNLRDHPRTAVMWRCSQPVTMATYLAPRAAVRALADYAVRRAGPLAYTGQDAQAYLRSDPELQEPDLQLQLIPAAYADHGRQVFRWHGFMVHFSHLRPRSHGRVWLRSADPSRPPAVDPAYLQERTDLVALRRGLRIARDIVGQAAFDPFRGEEAQPGASTDADGVIDDYIRASVDTGYHPVGTCRMGEDREAVVDSRLRVHGVEGLRVVDASVMPRLPSGNTNVPVMMIAERAADLIAEDGRG